MKTTELLHFAFRAREPLALGKWYAALFEGQFFIHPVMSAMGIVIVKINHPEAIFDGLLEFWPWDLEWDGHDAVFRRVQPRPSPTSYGHAAVKVAAAPPAVTDGGAHFTPLHGPFDAGEIGAATETAPIRTTSPGLTVYRGGAFTPRYLYTRQSLGGLIVDRHAVRPSFSYTPTPTLQLEAEVPFMRSSFASGGRSGSDIGFGNLVLWGKYRFFRTLETWGDRQASIRLGFELPSGKKSAPGEDALDAPEYVRQQLGPVQGGVALHTDLAYSQARGRIIYGASVVAVARGERDGFRTGHELSVNTDFEYVLLPRKYQAAGRELFAILETTYSYRGRGRLDGREVRGSSASEFYLAPGLQYAAAPRFVIEASYQFPVIRNTGPLTLRTDRNLLVGLRYLY